MIEKFLFKKIELWILLLTILLGFLGAVWFGYLALSSLRGGKQFPGSELAYRVATFPDVVFRLFSGEIDYHRAYADNPLPAGFTYYAKPKAPNYILVNRYDGNIRTSVSEFYREGENKPMRRWIFEDAEHFRIERKSVFQKEVTDDASTRRAVHPLLDMNGNLIMHFADGSALYNLNSCSNLVWRNEEFAYHHSLEMDADGNFWSPGSSLSPITRQGFDQYVVDDHIVQISSSGQVLFSKSVFDILIENNLRNRIYVYDKYIADPIHLNDIQPALADGAHWRKGDVFLSLAPSEYGDALSAVDR